MSKSERDRENRPARDPAGRTPAHDLAAEGGLLSKILNQPAALFEVLDILRPDHFYSDANRYVFQAMLAIADRGEGIDLVSVHHELRVMERFATVGVEYLQDLFSAQPDVAYPGRAAAIIVACSKQRRIVAIAQLIAAEGYDPIGDVDAWLDECEGRIHEVTMDRAERSDDSAHAVLQETYRELLSENDPTGIGSGLSDLDRLMGLMKPQQLIVVGALPGCGKTSLGYGIAQHIGLRPARDEVLVFSLEMSKAEIVQRAHFGAASVDSAKLADKLDITAAEYERLAAQSYNVALRNLRIDDRKALSTLQIRAKARRVQAEAQRRGKKLALVVIDYLQLVKGAARRYDTREQEVADISRSLKALAGELGTPIIALAQLNADSATRAGGRPRAADLRESKAIWADADKVVLIHAPAAVERAELGDEARMADGTFKPEVVELIVDKNRGGRMGICKVLFHPSYTTFTGYVPDRDVARYAETKVVPMRREGSSRYGAGNRGQG